jgi:LmbE family N-acetylglucosaminyl deacetylase
MRELALPSGELSILCVGAHPDDIEIGCGATLLLMRRLRKATFTHLILTGSPERRLEAEVAAGLFDGGDVVGHSLADGRLPASWDTVKSALEELSIRLPVPDLIFAPRVDDAHQDHRLLGRLTTTTWRDSVVLHYDIPKWDGDFTTATTYVRVPDDIALLKAQHLQTAFLSQHEKEWWDEELFLAVMRIRGMECRSRYAEAFVLSKGIISIVDPAAGDPLSPT